MEIANVPTETEFLNSLDFVAKAQNMDFCRVLHRLTWLPLLRRA